MTRGSRDIAFRRVAGALLVAGLAVAGCAAGPRPADWRLEAKSASERYVLAFLVGSRAADADWWRLRQSLASTAEPGRVAQAELLRCAVQVASLDWQPSCVGFEALRRAASPEELAYADYLLGRWTADTRPALGPAQRRVAQQGVQALPVGEEPLSTLLGAAVLLRSGTVAPAEQDRLIGLAVDTASAQGWRRPLLAWLGLQLERAQAQGRPQEAERIRQRLAVLQAQP